MKLEKRLENVSRLLSLVLRHRPEKIGLELDSNGWVTTKQLLVNLKASGNGVITLDELEDIVRENNKKRFEFNSDHTKIRASQGHSLGVDLQYEPLTPPIMLFHGTSDSSVENIRKTGLSKFTRDHVHLSDEVDTAATVGARKGKVIVLIINALEMYNAGYVFYKSTNGVWLTNHVPAEFIDTQMIFPNHN